MRSFFPIRLMVALTSDALPSSAPTSPLYSKHPSRSIEYRVSGVPDGQAMNNYTAHYTW